MEEYIQVFTTTDSEENANEIAKVVLSKKLAGCTQIIGPIISSYWWNDNIENSKEWLCLIKSKRDLFPKLCEAIKEIHPYTVPEIVALPIIDGSKEYLEWLSGVLHSTPSS